MEVLSLNNLLHLTGPLSGKRLWESWLRGFKLLVRQRGLHLYRFKISTCYIRELKGAPWLSWKIARPVQLHSDSTKEKRNRSDSDLNSNVVNNGAKCTQMQAQVQSAMLPSVLWTSPNSEQPFNRSIIDPPRPCCFSLERHTQIGPVDLRITTARSVLARMLLFPLSLVSPELSIGRPNLDLITRWGLFIIVERR